MVRPQNWGNTMAEPYTGDRIILKDLGFYGYHGVFAEEAKLGQRFFIDLELGADLTAPAAQGVVGFIAYLRSMLDGEHPLLDRGLLAEQAESHLLTSILLSLRHNHSDRLTMSGLRDERITTVLPRIVKRSQDYMRAHAEAPITLADVCQHVGVSARSLQLAFHRHHGVSPMEFLRELRLDLVHRALLAGADPTLKVSEVAARYGFLHLGHFAARYRERFAQTPSDTLARSKRR